MDNRDLFKLQPSTNINDQKQKIRNLMKKERSECRNANYLCRRNIESDSSESEKNDIVDTKYDENKNYKTALYLEKFKQWKQNKIIEKENKKENKTIPFLPYAHSSRTFDEIYKSNSKFNPNFRKNEKKQIDIGKKLKTSNDTKPVLEKEQLKINEKENSSKTQFQVKKEGENVHCIYLSAVSSTAVKDSKINPHMSMESNISPIKYNENANIDINVKENSENIKVQKPISCEQKKDEVQKTIISRNKSLKECEKSKTFQKVFSKSSGSQIQEMEQAVKYYRELTHKEIIRLTKICEDWENQNVSASDSINDIVDATIDQTRLFLNNRMKYFCELVNKCENDILVVKGIKPTSVNYKVIFKNDLEDYWCTVQSQIEDIDKKFLDIEKIIGKNKKLSLSKNDNQMKKKKIIKKKQKGIAVIKKLKKEFLKNKNNDKKMFKKQLSENTDSKDKKSNKKDKKLNKISTRRSLRILNRKILLKRTDNTKLPTLKDKIKFKKCCVSLIKYKDIVSKFNKKKEKKSSEKSMSSMSEKNFNNTKTSIRSRKQLNFKSSAKTPLSENNSEGNPSEQDLISSITTNINVLRDKKSSKEEKNNRSCRLNINKVVQLLKVLHKDAKKQIVKLNEFEILTEKTKKLFLKQFEKNEVPRVLDICKFIKLGLFDLTKNMENCYGKFLKPMVLKIPTTKIEYNLLKSITNDRQKVYDCIKRVQEAIVELENMLVGVKVMK